MTTTLETPLPQLSSFQYIQQHQNPNTQHVTSTKPATLTDECCTITHDADDFCCAPVEPSSCCGPQSRLAVDSLDCCNNTHSLQQQTISGYSVQEVECCIIESVLKEGMDSECCQDLVPPGTITAGQQSSCCSEHPEVLNDCCLTCCPDTLSPSAGGSTSASSTSSTPSLVQPSHYFSQPSQQCSTMNDPWNTGNLCNHIDSHLQRNNDGNNTSHSAFHFLSGNNNDISNQFLGQSSGHLSHINSISATPNSMMTLPDEIDDAQIDHIIHCMWNGCTAEFLSQDELLPHVSQLHLPTFDSEHALCLWESCATQQPDANKLLQHLRADHHIVPPSPIVHDLDLLRPEPKLSSKLRPTSNPSTMLDSTSQSEQQNHTQGEQHYCRWKGCGRVFANFDSLTTHLSEDHIGMGKSQYICEWEGCERNGRGFAQRQKAMRHIQTHTGDKPYQCHICKKRFSEANIMAQHMRTHTGEKPFKCPEPGCGREFSISGALTIHRRVHTGEKPFKCKFEGCDKWFAESSNLTKHLRVHTGERPFQCPFPGCEKKFSRPDQVTRHRRTHMSAAEKAAEKSAAEALTNGSSGSSKSQKRTAPLDESMEEDHLMGDHHFSTMEENSWSSSVSPASIIDDFDSLPVDNWEQGGMHKRIKS